MKSMSLDARLRDISDQARLIADMFETALAMGTNPFDDGYTLLALKRLKRLVDDPALLREITSTVVIRVLRQLCAIVGEIIHAIAGAGYEPTNEYISAFRFAAKRIDELNAAEPKGKRGRKRETDEKEDKRIFDGWKESGCRSYEDYAGVCGRTERKIRLAVDRHEKRLRAQGNK
jgi:hypothetical protein